MLIRLLTPIVALGGCITGLDFVRLSAPDVDQYVTGPRKALTPILTAPDGSAANPQDGAATLRSWRHWFGSPAIEKLVDLALSGSLSLKAVRGRLSRAEYLLTVERGLRYPSVSVSGNANYSRGSGASSGAGTGTPDGLGVRGGESECTVYTGSLAVSYNSDLFGREDRLVQSAAAQVSMQRAELQAGSLSIAGNIVSTAIEAASARARIAAYQDLFAGQVRRLELIGIRVEDGYTARAELVGIYPADADIPEVTLHGLTLPKAVPIALPSERVRLRPDILAAGLLAPLFEGGRLTARRRAAVAGYQQALADYQQTVLAAFREVSNGIHALENGAEALVAQGNAMSSVREALELAEFRLDEGAISVVDVLVIDRRNREALLAYFVALAQRLQNTAALLAAVAPGPLDAAKLDRFAMEASISDTKAMLASGKAAEPTQ